jgi:hypothetical protein
MDCCIGDIRVQTYHKINELIQRNKHGICDPITEIEVVEPDQNTICGISIVRDRE